MLAVCAIRCKCPRFSYSITHPLHRIARIRTTSYCLCVCVRMFRFRFCSMSARPRCANVLGCLRSGRPLCNANKPKNNPCITYKPLGSWSASTSPARSPSPTRYGHHGGVHHRRRNHLQNPTYGTTSLCQRSRSPSPARLLEMRERDRLAADEMGTLLSPPHFVSHP